MLQHHKFIIQPFGIVMSLTYNANVISAIGQTIVSSDYPEQEKLADIIQTVHSIDDIDDDMYLCIHYSVE